LNTWLLVAEEAAGGLDLVGTLVAVVAVQVVTALLQGLRSQQVAHSQSLLVLLVLVA
jgi:hypothetical protein